LKTNHGLETGGEKGGWANQGRILLSQEREKWKILDEWESTTGGREDTIRDLASVPGGGNSLDRGEDRDNKGRGGGKERDISPELQRTILWGRSARGLGFENRVQNVSGRW